MKYVPKKTKIKDYRNDDGGYYIAKCITCGTEYYPKQETAKYCSDGCSQRAFLKGRKKAERKKEREEADAMLNELKQAEDKTKKK